jgi:hypothetical protein
MTSSYLPLTGAISERAMLQSFDGGHTWAAFLNGREARGPTCTQHQRAEFRIGVDVGKTTTSFIRAMTAE